MRLFKFAIGACIVLFGSYCVSTVPVFADDQTRTATDPADVAVERTRRQVKMLDDIYKGSIVLVTKNYVDDEDDLAAGTAFKQIFAIAKDNGWHEVRLVDATDDPYEPENAPRDGFEKRAIEVLKSGKAYVNEVVENDKGRFLDVATPIPVVMDKCVMCHSHYADVEAGKPIGALVYRVPLVE